MVTYLVSRTVSDGLPAGDFNAMNQKAKKIFDCGHAQNIQVCTCLSCVWIRADCHPELKKNTVYKIVLSLSNNSYDIESASVDARQVRGQRQVASTLVLHVMLLLSFVSQEK
jgi:hypothetical protein